MTNTENAAAKPLSGPPLWTIAAPVFAGAVFLAASFDLGLGQVLVGLIAIGVAASVFAAVHHADVVAHRIGEPFGTLVLALAVTFIEVGLIVSLMLAAGPSSAALARDTVFATVMIILTGIVGLCLLIGSLRHSEQRFSVDGVSTLLVTLAAIVIMTLVFPNVTVTVPGPYYSPSQLIFIAIVSLVIYAAFVYAQTSKHRHFFLDEDSGLGEHHPGKPSNSATALSAALLVACLAAVVLLAKKLAPSLEAAVAHVGAPHAVVGVIIASIVLLPEATAAVRAAAGNRLQTSLNLGLGSAIASIGLTIPTVSFLSIAMDTPLMLGIDSKSEVLLVLSLFITAVALRTGRTNILLGVVLLVLFAVYLFTTVVP